jgi:hypothetical protein
MSDNEQYWLNRVSRTGRPPSMGASKEEKDAYEALVKIPAIESGELSVADLPESYGGRPKGTTRRAMRMQAEYDALQRDFLQNQKIAKQMEIEEGVYNLRLDQEDRALEDREIAFEAAQMKAARDAKVQQEAKFIFEAIRGGTPTSDGGVAPPINPNDEDALFQISNLMRSEYGMEHPVAKEAVTSLYRDALRAQQKREADVVSRAESDTQKITELTKLAKLTERNASDLFTIDPETKAVVVNPAAVGEAEADLAMREKAGREGPSYSEIEKDARLLRGKIRDINLDILIENNVYNKAKTDKEREKAQSRIEQLEAQRDYLSTEYAGLPSILEEGAARGDTEPSQPEIPKFNSPEEAEAADLPSGTIIEINGRRARID